jgi:hypothetical protein
MQDNPSCTVFAGERRIASGALSDVATKAKGAVDRGESVFIFDDVTAQPIEVDFRGSAADVRKRLAQPVAAAPPAPAAGTPRGPGRPKLGVVAREVTLLPRHWDWLNAQPGGASVALRKLVEDARRQNGGKDRARRAREVAYRFMSAMAGNRPGFEEAARALFAGDRARFDMQAAAWPADIRTHAAELAAEGFVRASEG